MIINKKGSNWANPYVIITILLIFAIFSYILIDFGSSLANNPNNKLDSQSMRMIENETGQSFKINNKTIDDTYFLSNKSQQQDFFRTNSSQVRDPNQDFAVEFSFGLSSISQIWDTIVSIYQLPSTLLRWTPLNYNDFKFVINAFSMFFWIVLFGIVIWVVRGFSK